jgi:predicted ribosomally synthesized peptide with nif11-like leader
MSIQNAKNLLQVVDRNTKFRKEMYNCINGEELQSFLEINGFTFDIEEFDQATNILHVNCQTLGEAQDLLHKAEWLRYMLLTA